jgi:hypothetical protein
VPYSNSIAFYDEVLSRFLYGQEHAPASPIDEGLIRPIGVHGHVDVPVADYMSSDGQGRFAIHDFFEEVEIER